MKILIIGLVQLFPQAVADEQDLEIVPGLQHDGPSRNILALASALAKLGHQVLVLSSSHTATVPEMSLAGVKVIAPLKHKCLNPWADAQPWLSLVENQWGRPDVVVCNDVYDLFQVSLARTLRRQGVPYAYVPRGGLAPFAQGRKRVKKRVANALFFSAFVSGAAAVIALSVQEEKDIRLFDPSLPVMLSSNGVTDRLFNGVSRIAPAAVETYSSDTIIVGYLGQVDLYRKGIDRLLEAIGLLQKRQQGGNLAFQIMGPIRIPSDRPLLEKMLSALPNPAQVKLLGPKYAQEKWQAIQALDIFIMTSRVEGLPTACLEAMAFGKACIVGKSTNMTEILTASGGGWTCDDSVEAIANALAAAANAGKEAVKQLGSANRAYVQQHLGWDQIAEKLVSDILRKVVSKNH